MASTSNYARYSRYDKPYSTDHWSKLKVKSFQLTLLPWGQHAVMCAPKEQSIMRRRHSIDTSELQPKNTLATTGHPQLNQQISYYLPPVQQNRQTSGGGRRVTSASGERARMGFKYWVEDTKKTRPGTKATLGSQGSFLGVGTPRL